MNMATAWRLTINALSTTEAAEHGNIVAMNKLGLIYETGELVEQDYDKARYWYSLAAQQGSTFAAAKIEELPPIASEK